MVIHPNNLKVQRFLTKYFKIGDYIKLTNLSEQDKFLNRHKGEIGIVKFIDDEDIYVDFSNCGRYTVSAEQIELYKERCIESIILAHGITKNSLVKSITDEIKQYITDNYDVSDWL